MKNAGRWTGILIFLSAAGAFAQQPSAGTAAQASADSLVKDIQAAVDLRDDVLARVLVKQLSTRPRAFKQWWEVRQILYERPQVGFDYLAKWDRLRPAKEPASKVERQINASLARADALQSQSKFNDAFRLYQVVARHLKKEMRRGSRAPRFLYWTVVHNMARTLYGAGRYLESMEVYEWIPPDYYKFRQVLFEKMWAAFRAKRYDRAMGAIASQQSSYFSSYLEPETYLVQLYLFKKLCRMEEHKKALSNVETIMKRLDPKSGNYRLEEWAQSDVETKVLYKLATAAVPDDKNKDAKLKEQAAIMKALEARFASERRRLESQFKTVLAYSRLSVALDKEIIVTDVVPDRGALMASRREFWPVEDAEDWIDELGQHLYIGESQCAKTEAK